jgi:Zn-dependent protease
MSAAPWLRLRTTRVFGASIYVHWHVLIAVCALAVIALGSWIFAVGALISYITAIFIHEVGHAAVARQLGYDVHAIRIGLVHGRCEYEHPHSLWDASLISWGGVVAQLLVAAVVFTVAAAISGETANYFGPIVICLGYLNVVMAMMNLIPRPPLDGDLAWRIFPAMRTKLRVGGSVRSAIKRAARRR